MRCRRPLKSGNSVWSELGPWTFSSWRENYPRPDLGRRVCLDRPARSRRYAAEGEPVYTFADAKGLVFFAGAPEDARAAAWEFVKWVYSDPQHDLTWFQTTNLPPTRDDVSSNQVFSSFLNENPALVQYAEEIPYAVPPIVNQNYSDIQTALSDEGLIPAVKGDKTPEQAWEDAKTAMQGLLGN